MFQKCFVQPVTEGENLKSSIRESYLDDLRMLIALQRVGQELKRCLCLHNPLQKWMRFEKIGPELFEMVFREFDESRMGHVGQVRSVLFTTYRM